ncbi:hypothetical protein GCM10009613_53840 [Pseudonocardia kongjuensis]|uniref:Uncharacterized protein n=2 Tax=Pseudonocardia kongjuensis TaxID=102227 RepID=A0ABN1Y818_9PSEU
MAGGAGNDWAFRAKYGCLSGTVVDAMDEPPPQVRRAVGWWAAAVATQVAAVLVAATTPPRSGVLTTTALVLIMLAVPAALAHRMLAGRARARTGLVLAGAVGALLALVPPGTPSPFTAASGVPAVLAGLGVGAAVLTVVAALASFTPRVSDYLAVPGAPTNG